MISKYKRASLLTSLVFICSFTYVQNSFYSSQNAHSHNDYLNANPFYNAYTNGFGSIEADIYPVNGELLVAHNLQDVKKENTLKKRYLNPILFALTKDSKRKLILLVDIKQNYRESLSLLIEQLKPLRKLMRTFKNEGRLTVVISGERPAPAEFINYPDYIFFDDDHKQIYNADEWKRVGMVSMQFYGNVANWKGDKDLSKADKVNIQLLVDSVHKSNKPLRFWGAPDNPLAWKTFMDMKIDLIGTDHIEALKDFLNNEALKAKPPETYKKYVN